MDNVKPVSDLNNYQQVLEQVTDGNPVYLTRDGHGEYAIVTMHELEKLRAMNTLLAKLQKAEQRSDVEGWISADRLEKELGV